MKKKKIGSLLLALILTANPIIGLAETNLLPSGTPVETLEENFIAPIEKNDESVVEIEEGKEVAPVIEEPSSAEIQPEVEPQEPTIAIADEQNTNNTAELEKESTTNEIIFTSKALERAIKKQLIRDNVIGSYDDLVTTESIKLLTSLFHIPLEDEEIVTDLSGLEHAINLVDLTIYGTGLNYSPLYKLGNLQKLSLKDKSFTSGDLAQMKIEGLTELKVSSCGITDITELSRATKLKKLIVSDNGFSDVTPIKTLVNLEILFLSSNQISDVSPLSSLINLETLMLDKNLISDVSPLAGLSKLDTLSLASNQIADARSLEPHLNYNHSWGGHLNLFSQRIKTAEVEIIDGELDFTNIIKFFPDYPLTYFNISNDGIFEGDTFTWKNISEKQNKVSYWYRSEPYVVNGGSFSYNFNGIITIPIKHSIYTKKISFQETPLTIQAGVADPNLLDGLKAIDEKDGDVSASLKVIESTVDAMTEGVYNVTYQAMNSKGKISEFTRKVTVEASAPEIKASDITLEVNDFFNPLLYVTANDLVDGDLTSKVKVIKNNVKPKKAGQYDVTYEVANSFGKISRCSIKVHVVKNTEDVTINDLPKSIEVGSSITLKAGAGIVSWRFDDSFFEQLREGSDADQKLVGVRSFATASANTITLKALKEGATTIYAVSKNGEEYPVPMTIVAKKTENNDESKNNKKKPNIIEVSEKNKKGDKASNETKKKNLPKTNEIASEFVTLGYSLVLGVAGLWFIKKKDEYDLN